MTARPCARLASVVLVACALATAARAHAPHDVVTALAISPDYATDQTLFASFLLTNEHLFARSQDGGRSWQQFAPAMVTQGMQALTVSPDYGRDGTLFAATGQGGVYKSTDQGLTWTACNVGLTTLDVRDVVVSPAFATDATLVAVTDAGVFRSTDGGDSWAAASDGLVETDLEAAAWSPGGQVIYVGGRTMHISFDGGRTWVPQALLPSRIEDIAVSPQTGTGSVSAVCFGRVGGGVFASTDHGASYEPSVDGLDDLVVNALGFASDGTLYGSSGIDGVLRTDTLFGTWSSSLVGFEVLSPLATNHFTHLVVSPDHATDDTVVCGAFEGVFISHDRAQTWQQQEVYTQRLNRLLAFSPNYAVDRSFYVGNYGGGPFLYGPGLAPADDSVGSPGPGLQPTDLVGGAGLTAADVTADSGPPPAGLPPYDPANPWMPLGTGLTLFSGVLAPSPDYGLDHTLFYGYVHLYRSTDRGRTWENLDEPLAIDVVRAMVLSPDFSTDGIMFIGSGGAGTYRSGDHGDTWQDVSSNLPDGLQALGLHMSPQYPEDGLLWIHSRRDGVWRTSNDGGSWENQGLDFGEVRAFAVSPAFSHDQTLFAGLAGEGVFRSTDGGDSWMRWTTELDASEEVIVADIALSPAFGFDGIAFASTLTHGILRSTDGGATWTTVNAGLPLSAGREIATSPDFRIDRTLVHTNYDWVYISHDAGDSWSRLPGYVRVDESHQHVRLEGEWTVVSPALEDAVASLAGLECETEVDGHHGPRRDAGPHGVTAFGLSSNYGIGSSVTSTAGDAASLTFFGDGVDVYSVRTPLSAVAHVEVDGEVVGSIDLYAPEHRFQQRVFTKRFAELGWHTVRLVHAGSANPASGGSELHTDGFAYSF